MSDVDEKHPRLDMRILVSGGKRVLQQRYSRFERLPEGWREISEWRDVPVVEEEEPKEAA